MVRAITDEAAPRTGLFLVRDESPGVEVDPVGDQVGLRAAAGHDVVFTEVAVAAEAALGLRPLDAAPDPAGVTAAELSAAWRDLALAAVQLGVGRAALDWLVGFLSRRTAADLGEPLGGLPRYQVGLGEVASALVGAEELVVGLAARIDAGESGTAARTGAARLLADRAVVDAVQRAVALTGAPGLSRRHPLERYLRDALSGRLDGCGEERVLAEVGRAALLAGAARPAARPEPCADACRAGADAGRAGADAGRAAADAEAPAAPLSGSPPRPAPRGGPAPRRRTADGSSAAAPHRHPARRRSAARASAPAPG